MTAPASPGQGGFILVETIVAFAILAVALGVSMQTISQSATTLVHASDIEAAGLVYGELAERQFPELGGEGEFTGELDSGEPWRIVARAVRDSHVRPLLSVTATVWPRGADGPAYSYQTFVSNSPLQVPP
ncbi:MAG: type II secretion system GspH family protein [Mesorhizobium sp.]|nr:type II secretion system protein [Mesorhizobium sp.]MCO5159987.1 type II secretion system GspH family protein [Mesorhizobium sp.]